jgi:hypothetical protein
MRESSKSAIQGILYEVGESSRVASHDFGKVVFS